MNSSIKNHHYGPFNWPTKTLILICFELNKLILINILQVQFDCITKLFK